MSKAQRILVILHLCIVFTILSWAVIEPPLRNYVKVRSLDRLYGLVMGDPHLLAENKELASQLETNRILFALLPDAEQAQLQQQRAQLSSGNWAEQSLRGLLVDLPPLVQIWALFSFLICLFLLLGITGASAATWLLPVIAFLYIIVTPNPQRLETPEEALFPSEQLLVDNYLDQPLQLNMSAQREQLLEGWHRYLADVWAQEAPISVQEFYPTEGGASPEMGLIREEGIAKASFSTNEAEPDRRHSSHAWERAPGEIDDKIARGAFAFELARLKARQPTNQYPLQQRNPPSPPSQREPSSQLCLPLGRSMILPVLWLGWGLALPVVCGRRREVSA